MSALADDEQLEKEFMVALAADQAGDCDKALPLYTSLANEGVSGAMINLGNMHLTGHCVEKEPLQAEYILQEGINSGDEASKVLLIEYYSNQNGPLYAPRKKRNCKLHNLNNIY